MVALLAAVFLPAASGATAGAPSPWSGPAPLDAAWEGFFVTPFAGVFFPGAIDPQPNTGFFEGLDRPSSFLVGFRASRRLSRHLVVEFSLSRSRTENLHRLLYVDPDPPEGNPPFGIQTLRNSINPVLRLGGGLLLAPPLPGPVAPHASLGLGWVRHLPRRQVSAEVSVPLEDGTVFADTIVVPEENVRFGGQGRLTVDVGGGLTAGLTSVLSVRLDAVLHASRFSPLDVDGPLTGDVFYAPSQWVYDWEVSTGILFAVPRSGWTGGPMAGVAIHRLRGDDVLDSDSRRSVLAGVSFRYHIGEAFAIQPEFLRLDRTVRGEGETTILVADVDSVGTPVVRKEPTRLTYRVSLKDLEIPVLARVTILPGAAVRPYVVAGPSFSLNMGGEYRAEYESDTISGDFPFHKSPAFGFAAGGGVEIDLGPGTLSAGARIDRTVTRMDDSPEDFGGPFEIQTQALMIHAEYTL